MITTVTLNPAIDKTITVNSLKYGSVNRVGKASIDIGGKGLNVSKVLLKLGNPTTAIGFLGIKNESTFMSLLGKQKIETDFVEVYDSTRTNTIIVELDKGITTNINEEGLTVDSNHFEALKIQVQKYAESSKYMVFSGSAPKGLEKTVYKELIEIANQHCQTVLDADSDLLIEGLKAKPFLIKPNIYELEDTFNVQLKTDEEIIHMSKQIIAEYGVKLVLISMGADGSILVTQDEAYKALPLSVEVKSTVGAGDSLVAGFIHGLEKGKSYSECLAYGTACGALAVMRDGVGNFTLEELEMYLQQVQVIKLH